MPGWGKVLTGVAGPNAVDYGIGYVRTLGDPRKGQDNDYMAAQGRKLYEGVCVACHGIDGKGNPGMGAPDLTDDYWLYGDSKESLHRTIAEGRHGSMPAHRELLGETRARLVAAYVWSLSNTGGAPAQPKAAVKCGPVTCSTASIRRRTIRRGRSRSASARSCGRASSPRAWPRWCSSPMSIRSHCAT